MTDPRVREAMAAVPRAAFVEPGLAARAAEDGPLPIGEGQTVSQPLIVALMAQALELGSLEIGSGRGGVVIGPPTGEPAGAGGWTGRGRRR